MTLQLTNTLTRQKEIFSPQDPARVTLYVCGPTVWNRAHIGNFRPPVVYDILFRLLRHTYGAEHVIYARNITDIDDKINAAAKAQKVDISVITQAFEKHYLADAAQLGVLPPTLDPHATAHMRDIIAMIDKLVAAGSAYEAQGHVLFHVPGFAPYGKLSRRSLDDMIAGARVDVAPYKRDPADFVLWKPSSDDLPGWQSPWGRGRPGWHIECSAMIKATLGNSIDIHAGGLDLIFPHHENEIAQSEAANGAPLAKIWLHNGFLSMNAEKMSKSLGNVLLLHDVLERTKGEVVRLALLSAHYRQPLDWTDALVLQSKAQLDRWYGLLRGQDVADGEIAPAVLAALEDDLNTPQAFAELAKLANARDLPALKASAQFMGLLIQDPDSWFQGDIVTATGQTSLELTASGSAVAFNDERDLIETKINERAAAKKNRNFDAADHIRDELKAMGVVLEDTPTGTTWKRG
jgi:cysteinyl-tRNA synthetase